MVMPVAANAGALNMTKRDNVVTFMGNPLTLVGPEIAVGMAAPDFQVVNNDLGPVTLEDCKGKVTIISAVPSLDTPSATWRHVALIRKRRLWGLL